MKLAKYFRDIKRSLSPYRPSIEVLVSKGNLLHNLHEFKKVYPHLAFAPVLKSNAYGHGLVETAEILDGESIAFFVLDSLYEAMVLRNNGIRSKILVVGYTQADNIKTSKLKNVSFTITSIEQLREIARLTNRLVCIHLKIDTGMHRQGLMPGDIAEAVKIIDDCKNIELEGVCSHFADADNPDDRFTQKQIELWRELATDLQSKLPSIKYVHISASAGTFYAETTPGNVARLGLSLYGIKASPKLQLNLRPALQIESVISSIKHLEPGEGVGYNLTYQTQTKSDIATVPMGYYEGIDRRLSNIGFYKINGVACPLVGRVSMNITSVDVTGAGHLKLGDRVIVISNNPQDQNSVENIALLAKTIPYEILVHIPQSLRRVIID